MTQQQMASTNSMKRIQADPDLQSMQVGSIMRKVKSRTWKKQRYFRLQDNCNTIWYQSKKAGNARCTCKLVWPWKKADISISEVEAVREGHQSEVLLSIADEFPPDRCFTLVFRGRKGNLDLVAESPDEAQSWINGVRKLIENLENMDENEKLDQWISDWFKKADKNGDGRMNFKEVRELLKMMNLEMNDDHALLLFTKADNSRSGTLEDDEFVQFYKMLTKREDVLTILKEYLSNGEMLSLQDLQEFLRKGQLEKENVEQHAKELIERYERSDTAKTRQTMTIDGFLRYLGSPEGSIYNQDMLDVYQDMSHPLCHYYISSSHNTYLMGKQLKGDSSVEGYIQALNRGCRCVEVDSWDGNNGEPIVYHGHTLTSKINFKDVINVLNNHAFTKTSYPLILSIENHCSMEQQKIMAKHLINILGDKLLKNVLEGKANGGLPSPEDLKGKILLKGKKIGTLEDTLNEVVEESLAVAVSDEEDAEIDEVNQNNGTLSRKGKSLTSKPSLSKELSDCVVYCKSVCFKGFSHSRAHSKSYEISSFTESKAKKLMKEKGAEFVHHNAQQLTRVYPSGIRTDSSNFNPQEMWNAGCQIVALNFQTAGVEMDLNDGFFRQNGNCGYVLKPAFLRSSEKKYDPENPETREGYRPRNLTIKVISGQQLPKVNTKVASIVDPLVRVEIYGSSKDQTMHETKYIDNNGFNPVWNETLKFTIHVPELALVRFVVEDHDHASKNDFVGQYTLPFCCIKQGYRHIHLLSKDGDPIPPASLFVHIRIDDVT